MNNGQSNAALLIVDLLTGARSFEQGKVVDALQLLAYDAGRKLQTSRAPVEVRDAAVRLHELAAAGGETEWRSGTSGMTSVTGPEGIAQTTFCGAVGLGLVCLLAPHGDDVLHKSGLSAWGFDETAQPGVPA